MVRSGNGRGIRAKPWTSAVFTTGSVEGSRRSGESGFDRERVGRPAAKLSDQLGVDHGSRVGVVFANRTAPNRAGLVNDIELCLGVSGNGPKRGDAEEKGKESTPQRPPNRFGGRLHFLFFLRNGERGAWSESSGVEN